MIIIITSLLVFIDNVSYIANHVVFSAVLDGVESWFTRVSKTTDFVAP